MITFIIYIQDINPWQIQFGKITTQCYTNV